MPSERRKPVGAAIRLALLILAFIPAYYGETRAEQSPQVTAVGFAAGFLMVLAAAVWRREKRPSFHYPEPDSHLRRRGWWLIPASLLALLTFNAVLSRNVSDTVSMRLWLLSLGFLVLPFWIRRSSMRAEEKKASEAPFRGPLCLLGNACTNRPREWWMEVVACALLLGVALAFRLPYLERYPVAIHNDSASCGLMARQLLEEWQRGEPRFFHLRVFYHYPSLGFIPYALFQMLFSPNLFAHRLLNVTGSMVALLCLYLLVRDLLGREAGLLTLGLAAVGHFAVHWSRSGISCGQAAFLMAICAWALWKAVSTGRARWFIITGVLLPMSFLTYQAAVLIPVWLGLVILVCWIPSSRFRKRYTVSFLLTGLAAVIFFTPMLAVYKGSPTAFVSRRSSMIFSSSPSTQKHLKGAYGEDFVWGAFRANLKRGLLLFSSSKDNALQYDYKQGGIMDDATAAALILGLAVGLVRLRSYAYWPLLLGIFMNWFLGGVLTVDAPKYHRVSAMAMVMYFAPALWGREIIQNAREAAGRKGTVAAGVLLAAGLVVVGMTNFRLYFIDFDHQSRHRREALRSCVAIDSRDAGPSNITYVHWGPFPKDLRHQAQQLVGEGAHVEGFKNLEEVKLPADRGEFSTAMFLIEPGAKTLLDQLRERFPNGRLEKRILPHFEPEYLYDRYIVPLGQTGETPSSQ
jgi:4-amino-4-deoxy-L-arabinose transferase-like glycosyltransferase